MTLLLIVILIRHYNKVALTLSLLWFLLRRKKIEELSIAMKEMEEVQDSLLTLVFFSWPTVESRDNNTRIKIRKNQGKIISVGHFPFLQYSTSTNCQLLSSVKKAATNHHHAKDGAKKMVEGGVWEPSNAKMGQKSEGRGAQTNIFIIIITFIF